MTTDRVSLNPSIIAHRWLHYGKRYAAHKTLHDESLVFASGPLVQNEKTRDSVEGLADYSGRTAGATLTGYLTNRPSIATSTAKGQSFWAYYATRGDVAVSFAGNLISIPGTLAMWIKPTSFGAGDSSPSLVNSSVYYWAVNGSSKYLQFYNGAWRTASTGTLDTEWHHVAIRHGTATTEMFVDGVQVYGAAQVVNSGGATTYLANRDVWTVGSDSYGLRGYMACPTAHSRGLSDAEIRTLALSPLEAYRVNVPRYWMFGTGGVTTHRWPWQKRRARRVRGAR